MQPEEQVKGQDIQTVQPPPPGRDVVREQDKIMLVLAYLGVLSLIPLLTVKDSDFVRWHSKNGLVIFGVWLALGLVSAVLPFIGGLLSCFGGIALLVVDIMAMIKALSGERWRIPGVSDLAEKL